MISSAQTRSRLPRALRTRGGWYPRAGSFPDPSHLPSRAANSDGIPVVLDGPITFPFGTASSGPLCSGDPLSTTYSLEDVGQRSGWQGEEQHRDAIGCLEQRDVERRRSEGGHQPALANLVHEGTEVRHEAGDPERAKTGLGEGRPCIDVAPARTFVAWSMSTVTDGACQPTRAPKGRSAADGLDSLSDALPSALDRVASGRSARDSCRPSSIVRVAARGDAGAMNAFAVTTERWPALDWEAVGADGQHSSTCSCRSLARPGSR